MCIELASERRFRLAFFTISMAFCCVLTDCAFLAFPDGTAKRNFEFEIHDAETKNELALPLVSVFSEVHRVNRRAVPVSAGLLEAGVCKPQENLLNYNVPFHAIWVVQSPVRSHCAYTLPEHRLTFFCPGYRAETVYVAGNESEFALPVVGAIGTMPILWFWGYYSSLHDDTSSLLNGRFDGYPVTGCDACVRLGDLKDVGREVFEVKVPLRSLDSDYTYKDVDVCYRAETADDHAICSWLEQVGRGNDYSDAGGAAGNTGMAVQGGNLFALQLKALADAISFGRLADVSMDERKIILEAVKLQHDLLSVELMVASDQDFSGWVYRHSPDFETCSKEEGSPCCVLRRWANGVPR